MPRNMFEPFYPNHYRYRRIDRCHRIDATDTVFAVLQEVLSRNILRPDGVVLSGARIRTTLEAAWVLSTLNNPNPHYVSLRNIQSPRQNWQMFKLLPSNLGKGFLFYFICTRCQSSVKHLYIPDGQDIYMCRNCHKLSYPTPNQQSSRNYTVESLSGPVTQVVQL